MAVAVVLLYNTYRFIEVWRISDLFIWKKLFYGCHIFVEDFSMEKKNSC